MQIWITTILSAYGNHSSFENFQLHYESADICVVWLAALSSLSYADLCANCIPEVGWIIEALVFRILSVNRHELMF